MSSTLRNSHSASRMAPGFRGCFHQEPSRNKNVMRRQVRFKIRHASGSTFSGVERVQGPAPLGESLQDGWEHPGFPGRRSGRTHCVQDKRASAAEALIRTMSRIFCSLAANAPCWALLRPGNIFMFRQNRTAHSRFQRLALAVPAFAKEEISQRAARRGAGVAVACLRRSLALARSRLAPARSRLAPARSRYGLARSRYAPESTSPCS